MRWVCSAFSIYGAVNLLTAGSTARGSRSTSTEKWGYLFHGWPSSSSTLVRAYRPEHWQSLATWCSSDHRPRAWSMWGCTWQAARGLRQNSAFDAHDVECGILT